MPPTSGLRDLDEVLLPSTQAIYCYGDPSSGKTALGLWWCRSAARVVYAALDAPLSPYNVQWAGLQHHPNLYRYTPSSLEPLRESLLNTPVPWDLVVLDGLPCLSGQESYAGDTLASFYLDSWCPPPDRNIRLLMIDQTRTNLKRRQNVPASIRSLLIRQGVAMLQLQGGPTIYRDGEPIGMLVDWTMLQNGTSHEGRWSLRWKPGVRVPVGMNVRSKGNAKSS